VLQAGRPGRLGRRLRDPHRVDNLDLSGHGHSDVPADEDRLLRRRRGGRRGRQLAVRRPDLVAAVVGLDGTLGPPAEVPEQTAPLQAAQGVPARREVMAEFLAAGFLPGDDQELLRRAIDDIGRIPNRWSPQSPSGSWPSPTSPPLSKHIGNSAKSGLPRAVVFNHAIRSRLV
jgi:hypothetical protein